MRRSPCVQCCDRQFGTFEGELTSSLGAVRTRVFPAGVRTRWGCAQPRSPGSPGQAGPLSEPPGLCPCAARSQAGWGARQYGCAGQRHRWRRAAPKPGGAVRSALSETPRQESCVLLGAAARSLGSKSSACLLEKHLKKGRLVSLVLHDTCLWF